MNSNQPTHALSPLDGRYYGQTNVLGQYFSEWALIKYRLKIEVEYLIYFLLETGIERNSLSEDDKNNLRKIFIDFSDEAANKIKATEKTTNHDVKAVEYFLREKVAHICPQINLEMIHFGLTSQDINNTAFPLMIKDALEEVIVPGLEKVVNEIQRHAKGWKAIPMLAHTHGQAATPTNLGKEFMVFVERMKNQISILNKIEITGKFGGATGNFNAHKIAFPNINWIDFGNNFLLELGLKRQQFTTQIEHYDSLASQLDCIKRLSSILLDLSRDCWLYISMNYFLQKTKEGEVGSSAMPHKVNPIDFENAEGNLGLCIALCEHLSAKLPVSRLQRDLTDSTVLRNIGVPFGHLLISINSICKGLEKLLPNEEVIKNDLEKNWAVVSEAIQTILRREKYPHPYEALKNLTRVNSIINKQSLHSFIDQLNVSDEVKNEMKLISPQNYTGIY
jgi:adenylosuccinate lyase